MLVHLEADIRNIIVPLKLIAYSNANTFKLWNSVNCQVANGDKVGNMVQFCWWYNFLPTKQNVAEYGRLYWLLFISVRLQISLRQWHRSAWNFAWWYISVPGKFSCLLGAVPQEIPQIRHLGPTFNKQLSEWPADLIVCRRLNERIRKFLLRVFWPTRSCLSAPGADRTRSRCCTSRTSRDVNRWRHTRTCRVVMTTERRRDRGRISNVLFRTTAVICRVAIDTNSI